MFSASWGRDSIHASWFNASGRLKLAFQQAAGVVGELCVSCIIGGIFRIELYGYLRAGTAAANVHSAKQLEP